MTTGGVLLVLHLLGACIWAGGHMVAAMVVVPQARRNQDVTVLDRFGARFERVAVPALLTQILTGIWLAARRTPVPDQWLGFSDAFSAHFTFKLALLAGTLAMALDAKLRVAGLPDEQRLVSMSRHVIAVTVLGVLLVVAGASLRPVEIIP